MAVALVAVDFNRLSKMQASALAWRLVLFS